MIFWDSSALVRCYFAREEGHTRANNLLFSEHGHQGSVLILPEATSAIVRKLGPDRRLRDSILRILDEHLKQFNLLPLDDAQIDRAVLLIRRHGLTAADAIHLSAAVALAREIGRSRFRFATADRAQAAAAGAEGLRVVDPAP